MFFQPHGGTMAVVKKSNTNRQAKNIQIKTSAVVVFPVDRISPYDVHQTQ